MGSADQARVIETFAEMLVNLPKQSGISGKIDAYRLLLCDAGNRIIGKHLIVQPCRFDKAYVAWRGQADPRNLRRV